jgi:hypothetical protein
MTPITSISSIANSREWHDRAWWHRQSQIDGTNWTSLGLQAARIYWRLGLTSSLAWSASS